MIVRLAKIWLARSPAGDVCISEFRRVSLTTEAIEGTEVDDAMIAVEAMIVKKAGKIGRYGQNIELIRLRRIA